MKHNRAAVLFVSFVFLSSFGLAQGTSLSPALQTMVEGNNRFAFKYLRHLQSEKADDNKLVAPTSISLAFGILQNGASTEANREIGVVFERQSLSTDQVNAASRDLLKTLTDTTSRDPNWITSVKISNSMWSEQSDLFRPSVKQIARNDYHATFHYLSPTPEASSSSVNAFLRSSLSTSFNLPMPKLRRSDFAVVAATLFNGKWSSEFDQSQTQSQEFRLLDHAKLPVEMMRKYSSYPYLRGDHFQAVYIPYTDGYGMYVMLPDADEGIDHMVEALTPENWKAWMAAFNERPGTLELPKFKLGMDRSSTQDLADLGLKSLFSSTDSLAKLVTGTEGARLTAAFETSSIEVNEKRTIVVTRLILGGGVVGGVGGGFETSEPFHVLCDHPFLFAIVEGKTKSILYLGVVTTPTKASTAVQPPRPPVKADVRKSPKLILPRLSFGPDAIPLYVPPAPQKK